MTKLLAASIKIGDMTISDSVSQGALKFQNLGQVVTDLFAIVFAFSGFALLLVIIASGFQMLASAGDPKKIDTAKSRLTYGFIGFFLVFSAFWITYIVSKIFGFREGMQIFPM